MTQKKINGYMVLLKNELGHGSYGSVYRGEQDGTKKEVAVKLIQKKKIDHDTYLKNAIFSEIQIMQMLKSENIVHVMDVMESSNYYYIIQEICDSDLSKYLKSKRVLPEQEATNLLRQICNGFIVLTKEGIIHRDIKPANILVSKGVIKIADFGFAKKNLNKRMKNESMVGTPLYMSTQVLKGQSYTSKCDVWAVGLIFYEMLHGKTPWAANSEYELIKNIQTKPLLINPQLKDVTRDFLTKTLKVQEKARLSWDEVFLHPIFKEYFHQYAQENQRFEDQLKRVMGQIRFQINSKNIDLDRLIDGLGFKHYKELNYNEFTLFIRHIHPKILKEEINFFLEKMDTDVNGTISIQELSAEMERHRIPLSKNIDGKNSTFMKQFNSNDAQQEKVMPCQLEEKVKKCFTKLYKILKGKGLTLYATYKAYDTDKSGQLNIDEFEKMIKRLDISFDADQITTVFNFIDIDQSKKIGFDQLNRYYCKVNGIPETLTLPPEYVANK